MREKIDEGSEKISICPKADEKYYFYYPQNVIVIGVELNGVINFMPAAWSSGLSYNPFLYGVSIGDTRYSHSLLHEAASFSVNFLDYKYIELVRSLGRSSGREMKKDREFKINYYIGRATNVPIMDLSYCSFECRKVDCKLFGDHTLFVGEVVSIDIEERCANKDRTLNVGGISPILYLGVDSYITIDKKTHRSLKEMPFHYGKGESDR